MISDNVRRSYTLLYRSTVILGLMAILRVMTQDVEAAQTAMQFQKSAQEYMDTAKKEITDLLVENEKDIT